MYLKSILLIFSCLALLSCNSGIVGDNYQENLVKLDKIYGYCDNPHRNLNKSTVQYKVCKDKEAAAGADGLSDDDFKLPFFGQIYPELIATVWHLIFNSSYILLAPFLKGDLSFGSNRVP